MQGNSYQYSRKTLWITALAIVGIVEVAACGVGTGFGLHKGTNADSSVAAKSNSSIPLATTPFGSITWDCTVLYNGESECQRDSPMPLEPKDLDFCR